MTEYGDRLSSVNACRCHNSSSVHMAWLWGVAWTVSFGGILVPRSLYDCAVATVCCALRTAPTRMKCTLRAEHPLLHSMNLWKAVVSEETQLHQCLWLLGQCLRRPYCLQFSGSEDESNLTLIPLPHRHHDHIYVQQLIQPPRNSVSHVLLLQIDNGTVAGERWDSFPKHTPPHLAWLQALLP